MRQAVFSESSFSSIPENQEPDSMFRDKDAVAGKQTQPLPVMSNVIF